MPTTAPFDLSRLFNALELDALPEDEQEEVILKFGELVFRDVLGKSLAELSDADRGQFSALVEKGDASADDIASFLVERVPDADALVGNAVRELADDILAVTGA